MRRTGFVGKHGTDIERARLGGAMYRNFLRSTVILCSLVVASSTGTFAQNTDAHQDADKAGREAKAAGKEAGGATKGPGKTNAKGEEKEAQKNREGNKDSPQKTPTGTHK